jgi:hypothetical protein
MRISMENLIYYKFLIDNKYVSWIIKRWWTYSIIEGNYKEDIIIKENNGRLKNNWNLVNHKGEIIIILTVN